MGPGGAGAGEGRGEAHPPEHRLCGLPLVPRDGAGVVRGPGHRRGDEPELREHQGGPGGAAGTGLHLHAGGAGDDGPGRLADDGLPDARPEAVLQRHLLPARRPDGDAGLPTSPDGADRRLPGASCRRAPGRRGGERLPAAQCGRGGVERAPDRRPAAGRLPADRLGLRRGVRRAGRRAQVPAADDVGIPTALCPSHG